MKTPTIRMQSKRILPLLFLLATVAASTASEFGDFIYTVTPSNTVAIEGYLVDTAPGGTVVVPETIEGLPVTIIASWAFTHANIITNITLPETLIEIRYKAFYDNDGITSITIPDSVVYIGSHAFNSCNHLASIVIPDSVSSIGDSAFSGCYDLASVTIGTGTTHIGSLAFGFCNSLTAIIVDAANPAYSSLDGILFNKDQTTLAIYPGGKEGSYTIPDSVITIGETAFGYCTSLTGIMMSGNITTIGDSAFYSCSGLTNVTIGSNITTIGTRAFNGCSSLASVTISDSVVTIGGYAFQSCSSLTSVTIPGGVTSIGVYAFAFSDNLTSITIGGSVVSIGTGAFQSCSGLTSVYFEGNAPSHGTSIFQSSNNVTVYYLAGTTGWGATYGDRPTALWNPANSVTLADPGVTANQFGFTINGTSGQEIVVEALSSLTNSVWLPLQTNTLGENPLYFSDSQWINHPARFYRVRVP